MNENISGKYLTFRLSNEEYGIAILKVREIIGMIPVTAVPRAPGFIEGVINLRGRVIPIMNLRARFGMAEAKHTDRTCIIVVELKRQAAQLPMGIIVDAVSEVRQIREQDIENTPSFGVKLATDFILGMAKLDGGVKILLDIDRVLEEEELSEVLQAA
jgi:purine-binding chemotaxis protein CheW